MLHRTIVYCETLCRTTLYCACHATVSCCTAARNCMWEYSFAPTLLLLFFYWSCPLSPPILRTKQTSRAWPRPSWKLDAALEAKPIAELPLFSGRPMGMKKRMLGAEVCHPDATFFSLGCPLPEFHSPTRPSGIGVAYVEDYLVAGIYPTGTLTVRHSSTVISKIRITRAHGNNLRQKGVTKSGVK